MKALRLIVILLLLLVTAGSLLYPQTLTLRGSSALELNIGFWNNMNASQQLSFSGITQDAKAGGFVGGLTYCYWMREHVAITVAGALLSSQTSTAVLASPAIVKQNSSGLASFLFGIRYVVPEPAPEDLIRPYVAVGVGSFMGFESDNSLLLQSAHSESVVGGRLGVGLDAYPGSSVKLGVAAGYNTMASFRSAVGARSNFDGFDFSMSIAYIFGGSL
ncbi:MAG TPA: hypothetical protein VMH23_10270 [Bacteroidota bacterium]|nr:hypothetical protein [Bacteroidota bacterium]